LTEIKEEEMNPEPTTLPMMLKEAKAHFAAQMEQQKLVLKLKEQATLCEYEYETACCL
jgi:hypothetical protein